MNTSETPEQPDLNAMSVLERRLAEIAARKQQDSAETPAAAPAPAAATAPQAEPVAESVAESVAEASTAEANAEAAMPVQVSAPEVPEIEISAEISPLTPATADAPADIEPTAAVAPSTLETPSQAAAAAVTEVAHAEVSSAAPVVEVTEVVAEVVAETAPADALAAAATSSATTADAAATVEPHEAQSSVSAAADMLTQPAAEPVTAAAAISAPAPALTAAETDAADAAADDDAEDSAEAPIEFADFDSLDAGAMSRLLLAAIGRAEAFDQAKTLIDRKREYEAKYDQEREEALKRFLAAGGDAGEFDRADTADHKALEKAWQQFRETRAQRRRQEEQQQAQNLERKQTLLQQLREMGEGGEADTDKLAPKIKALQTEWRSIGPVPYKESKELWQAYDALLDRFYSQRSQTFELKDLDRRKNLELKNGLILRAELLFEPAQTNPMQAARDLRGLHEEWKHVGPVPQDQREEVWARFIAASDRIQGKRTEELAGRRATEQEALERKNALMAQLEALTDFQSDRIEDWKAKTDELQTLKQQWDAAGYVPRAQASEMNKKFWALYKAFFAKKGTFFKALDDERMANVKRKEELIALAESHQEDQDYAATRDKYINWQKEWKTIGPVPERLSQKLWTRFRAACNAFFERPNREFVQRQQQFVAREAELNELSAAKNAYLDQVAEKLAASDKGAGSLDEYKGILASWNQFDADNAQGRNVPVAPQVEDRFFSLLSRYLDTVPITYAQKQELLFRQSLEQMKAAPDAAQRFARREQDLRRVITEQENEIATLRTNLGFFARSKNADSLRQEYEGRIQEATSRVESAKEQLKKVRSAAPPMPERAFGNDRDGDRRGGRPGGGGNRPGGFGGGGGGRR